MLGKGILKEDLPGAKRPSYSICYGGDETKWESLVSGADVMEEEDGKYYLVATCKDSTAIRERISRLDAERYRSGDLPLEHLLDKYCSYMNLK